jgi:hypothetical protein
MTIILLDRLDCRVATVGGVPPTILPNEVLVFRYRCLVRPEQEQIGEFLDNVVGVGARQIQVIYGDPSYLSMPRLRLDSSPELPSPSLPCTSSPTGFSPNQSMKLSTCFISISRSWASARIRVGRDRQYDFTSKLMSWSKAAIMFPLYSSNST